MTGRFFLDTNILIYAYTLPKVPSNEDIRKHDLALTYAVGAINESSPVISIQIVNEFHYNLIKRFKLADTVCFDLIQNRIFENFEIAPISISTWNVAVDLRQKYSMSYWDSMVAASAIENECDILYSEDMQHNQLINTTLRIINPLIASEST